MTGGRIIVAEGKKRVKFAPIQLSLLGTAGPKKIKSVLMARSQEERPLPTVKVITMQSNARISRGSSALSITARLTL